MSRKMQLSQPLEERECRQPKARAKLIPLEQEISNWLSPMKLAFDESGLDQFSHYESIFRNISGLRMGRLAGDDGIFATHRDHHMRRGRYLAMLFATEREGRISLDGRQTIRVLPRNHGRL